MKCELCEREVERLTIHHLIPRHTVKQKRAEPGSTTNICSPCHKQIHGLFDNKRLAKELNSLEALRNEPQMEKFLAWVKKQTPNKRIQVHRQKGL
ncbi:MAG TPA: HNH endonuclease [Allocoleopsis sp.]